jgi:RHS repeat-associated protein
MPVTNYLWDEVNDTLLAETDENGNTIAQYTHEPGQFGPLISQRRNGHTYYHHYDGTGSTRALTDESGNVTDRYTYTAFGEPVASSGTTTNPFGYKGAVGYYVNPESDDIYVRRRTYSPKTARWLCCDPLYPILERGPYLYSHDSPLGFFDPTGTIVDIMLPEGGIGSICFLLTSRRQVEVLMDRRQFCVHGLCPPIADITLYYGRDRSRDVVVFQLARLCKDPLVCSNSYQSYGVETTRETGNERLWWTTIPSPGVAGFEYVIHDHAFLVPGNPDPIVSCTVRRTIRTRVITQFTLGRCCEHGGFFELPREDDDLQIR